MTTGRGFAQAAFALLVGLASGFCGPAAAEEPDLGIMLCRQGAAAGEWEANALLAVGRSLSISPAVRTAGVRRGPCTEEMPDATCFAGPKILLCRSAAVERILKAAAWMAAAYLDGKERQYESFRLARRKAVLDAFRYADGQLADHMADPMVDAIRRRDATPTGAPVEPGGGMAISTSLYQGIADIVMVSLIGHELAHAFGERCPLTEASHAERSGLFQKMVNVQLDGSLFCPRNPVVREVNADRCALRHLRKLDERLAATGRDDGSEAEFVRRAASDMVAWLTLTGWRRYDGLPEGRYFLLPQREYLYETFRTLLLAAEVHGERPGPALCGEASSLFVHGVQETFRSCSKEAGGVVPDEVLARLPRGVEASWNGAPWTDRSHSCQAH